MRKQGGRGYHQWPEPLILTLVALHDALVAVENFPPVDVAYQQTFTPAESFPATISFTGKGLLSQRFAVFRQSDGTGSPNRPCQPRSAAKAK